MARTDSEGPTALVGIAIGALGPVAVALALVPIRSDLHNANLALMLVLVVVVAAIVGGRRAGALAAIVSTLAFDFFLTRPYLSVKIETSTDLQTAAILLGVGLIVGAVASRGRRSERAREDATDAINRVHRAAELIAQGAPSGDVVDLVLREIREVLHLHDCWLEIPSELYVMPRLERGGTIDSTERHWFSGGIALSEDGVELPLLVRGDLVGRIVLVGNEGRPVTIEERVVAVALADQLGAALALTTPEERARLATASRHRPGRI
jgi:hypothetical protein